MNVNENVLKPAFKNFNIPVVFATSDYFVPYLAVAIYSLVSNASPKYNYDIIVLNTSIGSDNRELLQKIVSQFSNVSLRVFDVSEYIKKINFHSGLQATVETFYRLVVPEIFAEFTKVVYLDCDIIVKGDISELYNIKMGGDLLGATRDADFCGAYNSENGEMRKYCNEILKLRNPCNYFQAGVIVFNIAQIKDKFTAYELVDYANNKKFVYCDQDVLNVKCENMIKYIDMSWNVLSDCGGKRIKDTIANAPKEIYDEYKEARNKPKIIHFAGYQKPWNDESCDFANEFWEYASTSGLKDLIIERRKAEQLNISAVIRNRRVHSLVDGLFPRGSRIRGILKKIALTLK